MKIISKQSLDVEPIPEQRENVTSFISISIFLISALYLGEAEKLVKSLQRAWKELKLNPEIDYSFHQWWTLLFLSTQAHFSLTFAKIYPQYQERLTQDSGNHNKPKKVRTNWDNLMQQISSLTGRSWHFSSYHNQRKVRGLNAESTNTSLACINKLSKNHYHSLHLNSKKWHEGNRCFSYDLRLTSAHADSDISHGDVKSCLT